MTPASPAASPRDRRAAQRYRPALATTCRFDPGGPNDPVHGLVWNISQSGVSMLVAVPPAPDTVLAGELHREGGPGRLAVLLRVVRVADTPTGDYVLGGQFLRALTPDELRPFVLPGDAADL